MPAVISTAVLAAAVAAAAVLDVRTGRIPNALTAPAVLAGLALAAAGGGLSALGGALAGAALALAIGGTLFALGGMGGGDAKLLVVVGAFLAPAGFLRAGLLIAVAGGLMSVAALLRHRVQLRARAGAGAAALDLARPQTVPYGVAIAAGTLLSLLTQGGAP